MTNKYSMVVMDDESTLEQEFSIKDLDDLYDVLESLYKECRKINSISTENVDANHKKIKLSVLLPFGRKEYNIDNYSIYESDIRKEKLYHFESDFENNMKYLKFSEAFTLMHNVVDELINEMV